MRRLVGLIVVPLGALLLFCSTALADPGFTYTDTTPGCQAYQIPAGFSTVTVSAVGASGGTFSGFGYTGYGGAGGNVTGQLSVSSGEALYLCVDQGGGAGDSGRGGGGGASGAAVGVDFSSPLVVAAGGGGGGVVNGGNAGYPDGASGASGYGGTGGGGGTSNSGGAGGTYYSTAGGGAGFDASGPGSGGNGLYGGGGGGAGYYGGGAGDGNTGGGGGSDYCDLSVSDCQTSLVNSQPSVTIQYLAPQTITFSSAVTYGQADFSPASSDSGLTVVYSNASGQCTIDGAGLLQITGAGWCTVIASQAGNSEYAPASVSQTLSIGQAVVHVDADSGSITYGQPDPSAAGTLRSGDFVNGDTASSSGITGSASCQITFHSANAATYTGVITCQPGSLSSTNYSFTAGSSAALTIGQATVHVDAHQGSSIYGQPTPSSSAILRSGDFVNGDTAMSSGITGSASCQIAGHSPNAAIYSGVITCQPGTLASTNYSFTAGSSAALTVNPTPPISSPTPPSSPTPSSGPTPVTAVAPVKLGAPTLSSLALGPHTVRWANGGRIPHLWLTFTLSGSATVQLALQTHKHGRSQTLRTITVSEQAGTDRVQLVGRWHGALLPARQLRLTRQLRLSVQARNAAGPSSATTLTLATIHEQTQPDH